MSASEIERALQDYLDGRMSDDERSAFETRLARDRDLAKRVAFFREVADSLREADIGLSPGFHTRARARFAESQAPSRRWIAPLVWTAGIATAALFTAIVLLPSLTERDPAKPSTVARLEQRDKEQDESTSRQQVPPPEAASPKREESGDEAGAPLPSDEPQGGRKDKLMKRVAVAPAKAAEPVLSETLEEAQRRGFAQLDAASVPADKNREKKVSAPDEGALSDSDAESFVVPAGRLATGEVLIIDDAGAWNEFSDLPTAYSPGRRIVLIGPRARPLDCARIVLRVEVDRRLVLLPASREGAAGSLTGCGIQVPADALEIVVGDMPENP